jgi:hypothetical protein
MGWLLVEHLSTPPADYPYPFPDFLQLVVVSNATGLDRSGDETWIDIDGHVLGSRLVSIQEALDVASGFDRAIAPYLELLDKGKSPTSLSHTTVTFSGVPRLSEFYGIVIYMYWQDHSPPHFHAIYAGNEAQVRISDGSIIAGYLPTTAARLVREWADVRRVELAANWDRAQRPVALEPIEPLG